MSGVPWLARARQVAAAHPWLVAVFVTGLVARAVLLPVTHGQDFVVWDLASQATLRGNNIYAHHPAYPGGPYAYLPLFLYFELPMQWLAQHTAVPFTVWGKLPIVTGDLMVVTVIAAWTSSRGWADAAVAAAAAAFFLNPLVLYNGAFYGRFDSVCVGLLLVAVWGARHGTLSWRAATVYAAAVAVKTFPIFVLPWFVLGRRRGGGRALAALAVVVGVVAGPYLVTSPHALVADLLYNAPKPPGSLSWQTALRGVLSGDQQQVLGDAMFAVFTLGALLLARLDTLAGCCLCVLLLFLVCSKEVVEQYLLWPMPLTILGFVETRRPEALGALALLTTVGMLVNPYVHPFGEQPAPLSVVLALALVATLVRLLGPGGVRQAQASSRETGPGTDRLTASP